jgi:hypothetical protein
LDLLDLPEPIYSGKYLASRLLEITDSLEITRGVFTITRDNVSANNTMLKEYEAESENQRLIGLDLLYQPWNFTWKYSNVRCVVYIINIAVQAALVQLKATPSKLVEEYRMEPNAARLPSSHRQDEVVSVLSKLRRYIYMFRNRRGFKVALQQQIKALGIKRHLLTLDMPVQ